MLIVQVKSRSPDACSITSRVRKSLLSKTDSSKLEKWKGAGMEPPGGFLLLRRRIPLLFAEKDLETDCFDPFLLSQAL